MYINLTKHCIKRIMLRHNKHDTKQKAELFGVGILRKFFRDRENKGKKVKVIYIGYGKYKITDGKHQFVYEKAQSEINVITYVKKDKKYVEGLREGERYLADHLDYS